MRNITSGLWLVLTGVGHNLIGLALRGDELAAIVSDGLFDTLSSAEREAAFWFEAGGILMILLGALMRHGELRGAPPPRWLGWSLLLSGLLGAVCLPVCGFWLIVLQGAWLLRRYRS